jgi:CNT family concentrative nucleoside transporter
VNVADIEHRIVSLLGYFVLIGLAWLMSSDHKKFPWRVVWVGSGLQVILAWLILKTHAGEYFFDQVIRFFDLILSCSDRGADFVFGESVAPSPEFPTGRRVMGIFAFRVLPPIIFVSALATVLYYLGIMQWVVKGFAILMQQLMGLSGAESLSASANIFMGQTEAPLLVKPFIEGMTNSELFAVMVGGFANISVSLIAVYSGMGINPAHLLTSSVISAPASLLLAKIIIPETQIPATLGRVDMQTPKIGVNVIEAAAIGAADGLKLALNVGAMLIAFVALIWLVDGAVNQFGLLFDRNNDWHLQQILGYLFIPLAWLIGVPANDCPKAGELLGIKLVATEFIAYQELGDWMKEDSDVHLTKRTQMLMTYALCGFSNFASIGIQIAGLGGMAPDRQSDIARLGLRAMIAGMLATCMTACVAGVLRSS